MYNSHAHIHSKGYAQHVEEIRDYANLVAGLLHYDLAPLTGEERIRLCHAILEEHPYAYPLALELSLNLPAATAITWLRSLCAAYYKKADVQEEIDAFMVWRMAPIQALSTALRHSERMGWFLPSVLSYLEQHHPMLAAYIKRRRAWDMDQTPCLAARLDRMLQLLLSPLRAVCSSAGCSMPLPRSLIPFYMREDSGKSGRGVGKAPSRVLAWGLMRLLASKVTAASNSVFRRNWAYLPHDCEPCDVGRHRGSAAGIDIVTVVWGEDYIQRFADLNAPSLLAPENLPALVQRMDVCLVFYTTRSGMCSIKSLPAYARLRSYAAVRFVLIDTVLKDIASDLTGIRFTDKYSPMTAAHNHCFRQAANNGRYVLCNFPDIILQEDMFTKLVLLIDEGKTDIYSYSGPYLLMERTQNELKNHVHNGVLKLDNATLRAMSRRNRHHSALLFYDNAPLRYFGAIMRLVDIGDEGFIAHMTCLCPILVKPEPGTAVTGTIDYSFPLTPWKKPEHLCILTDDTGICLASLDPEKGQDNTMRWPPYDFDSFARDFREGMHLMNRIFFSLPLRFYAEAVPNKHAWETAEIAGRAWAADVLRQGMKAAPVPPLELFLRDISRFLHTRDKALG